MANRKAFYDALRLKLGALTQANVVGFELVLNEAEKRGTGLNNLAYCLATAWWESGKTMQPVREAYWLSEAWRKKHLRYFPYYGRGLVQLTWLENYRKVGKFYGVDLAGSPDLAMDPSLSVRILFDGMEQGWFTGKSLGDYIDGKDESDDEDLREYVAARRIVNGVDRQLEIGKLALIFEAALVAANYLPVSLPPQPDISHYPEPPISPIPTVPLPAAPEGNVGKWVAAIVILTLIIGAYFIFGVSF